MAGCSVASGQNYRIEGICRGAGEGRAPIEILAEPSFASTPAADLWEIRRCNPPVAFGQPPTGSPFKATWKTPPEVIFRHIVEPVPNAQVLMPGAAGEPLWVGKPYGKGRVAVFTGTVLGEAPQGQTAFWQDPNWKDILAAAINWSAGK